MHNKSIPLYRHQETTPLDGSFFCHMFINEIRKVISNIAERCPQGFTFDFQRGELATSGYVVATEDTQDCFGSVGLLKVISYCAVHPGFCIGGWRNEDGIMQFDASMVVYDLSEALSLASKNCQRAIYDLKSRKTIMASEYASYAIAA